MFITLLRYTKSLQILPRMVGGERGACFEIRVTNLLLKIGCTRAVDVNARMFIYFYLLVVYGKLQPIQDQAELLTNYNKLTNYKRYMITRN